MNALTQYALTGLELERFDKERYVVEKSKDNKKIIKIVDDEKSVYLGSKYSTKRDVTQFIEQMKEYNLNTIFIVYGIGTGEHILELLKVINEKNKILIIEPDINILAMFKTFVCYHEIMEDDRVVVTLFEENKVNILCKSFIEEFNVNNIKIMIYANYDKLYKEELIKCYALLRGFVQSSAINILTTQSFSKQFFESFIKNIKHIIKSAEVGNFKDIYKGKPAVIVSAGPSLEKNIKQLTEVKEEFVIFSGGRTVSTLKAVGVVPDVVAVVDAGLASYLTIKASLDCEAPLAFCEVSNFDVVNQYKGSKIFFQEGFNLSKVTAEILGKHIDTLFQGGSVAHTCISLAVYMGCNPIIFIGQDLAYTNGKLHADIATSFNNKADDKNKILVDDVYGNKVMTDTLFNSYRKYIQEFISICPNTVFINSTEGGANIKGTKVAKLRDTIEKYKSNTPIDKDKIKVQLENKSFDKELISNNIKLIFNNMKNIQKDCKKAVKVSDEIMEYYLKRKDKNINALLKFISRLNIKIQKLEILNNLLQPVFYEVMMSSEYAEKQNETENERGIKLAKQTNKLYSSIVQSINDAIPLVEQCLLELKEME